MSVERRRSFDGRRTPREKVYLDRMAVRERLDAVGLTPEEASERMGFNPKYLDRVLRGGKAVSERARQALQRVLGRDLSATDVRATLPEGLARRGFPSEDVRRLQFPTFPARQRAAEDHKQLPGFVRKERLPSPLGEYFHLSYEGLNERLRKGEQLTEDDQKMLNQLLRWSRPLQVTVPLYRGVALKERRDAASKHKAPPEFKPEFSKDQRLTLLSPLSTSTNLHDPIHFAKARPLNQYPDVHAGSVMFEVHGTKGKYAVVTNEPEQEVLLAPGGNLRVLHVEPRVRLPGRRIVSQPGDPLADFLIDEWVVGEVE